MFTHDQEQFKKQMHAMPGYAPHRLSGWVLFLAAAVFLAVDMAVFAVRGPNWILIPQDLGYTYLLAGLNVLQGVSFGSFLVHPGITTSYINAVLIQVLHWLFGSGDLLVDVLSDPEYYMSAISRIYSAVTALALFLLGWTACRVSGSLRLGLLVMISLFMGDTTSRILNSYGSPENLQTICFLILATVSLQSLRWPLKDRQSFVRYAAISAVVCSLAIGTKFTALPIVLLPFLFISGLRRKAVFIAILGVVTLIVLSPALFHLNLFMHDVNGIVRSVAMEHQQRVVDANLFELEVAGLVELIPGVPLFFDFLALLVLFWVLVMLIPAWRNRIQSTPEFRLFVSATVMVLAATLMIGLRPKPHYLGPYTYVISVAIIMAAVLIRDQMKFSRRVLQYASWTGAVLYLLTLSVFTAIDSKSNLTLTDRYRQDVLRIHEIIERDYPDAAVAYTIPASHVTVALEHGYKEVLHPKIQQVLAETRPGNFYFQNLDGTNFIARDRSVRDLPFLTSHYSQVLFWTTNPYLDSPRTPGSRHLPIEVTLEPVHRGIYESLYRLATIRIGREHIPVQADAEGPSMWSDCGLPAPCIQANLALSGTSLCPSEYRLSIEGDSARMPSQWRVEGSKAGRQWSILDERREQYDWTAGSARTFTMSANQSYRYYRFIRTGGAEATSASDSWPTGVQLLSSMTSPRRTRENFAEETRSLSPLMNKGVPLLGSPGTFFEQVGQFPMYIDGKLDTPQRMLGYVLGTGNDGPLGIDSTSRMPNSWRLLGSDDGNDWAELDRRSGESGWQPCDVRYYNLSFPASFRFYRLAVDASNGARITRLYHWGLIGDSSGVTKTAIPSIGRGTFWEAKAPFPVLEIELKSLQRIDEYALHTGNHGVDATGRMPKRWRILGSQDGLSWETLDQMEDATPWNINERRVYSVQRTGSYRFLRLGVESSFHPTIIRLYGWQVITGLGLPKPPPVQAVAWRFEPHPYTAIRYQLISGNDDFDGLDSSSLMPEGWVLQGSDDGQQWHQLDQRDRETGRLPYEKRSYSIAEPAPYRMYRLLDDASDHRMYRWQLYADKSYPVCSF